jgi:hypothetical protein
MTLESLTTSYVSWANLNGEVIVSGKSGKQFNTKKNIRSRDYYNKLLIKPWELHIANPEKSLFSTKYVLPTAMSIEGENGKILGILVLGLRVDEINKRINEISLRQGYYINVFDKKRGTYITSNNTDSKAFDKDVDIDSIKKDLKGFQYSIHVEKKPLLIFLNNLEKDKFLFCLILLLISIIVFVFERYYRIIITNHDSITFLKKGKTLAETSLSHRERFYKASFNRFDESILDIESCMTFINNYTLDNDLKPIFMRIKDLMFDLRAITKEGKRNKIFDICSLLDESLLYFSSEIFDKNIIVAKSYQKTIPRAVGDEFYLKHVLVSIFGNILENYFNLQSLKISVRYLEKESKFFIEIQESSVTVKSQISNDVKFLSAFETNNIKISCEIIDGRKAIKLFLFVDDSESSNLSYSKKKPQTQKKGLHLVTA